MFVVTSVRWQRAPHVVSFESTSQQSTLAFPSVSVSCLSPPTLHEYVGTYKLKGDLFHEVVDWFHSFGVEVCRAIVLEYLLFVPPQRGRREGYPVCVFGGSSCIIFCLLLS